MGDWQPTRPPLTDAEKKRIDAAKRENAKERLKQEHQAHDERMADQKRQRDEAQKIREAREAKLKQMEPTLIQRRTDCRLALLEMIPQVRNRRLAWDNIIIDMTYGYSKAFTTFTKTIELQQKHEEKMAQVAFAVLSAVSVGGLSVLSTVAQSKWITNEVEDILANGLEDAIQVGADKVLSAVAPSSDTKAQDIPLPINYKGELEKLLNSYEKEINEWITAGGNRLRGTHLEFFEHMTEDDMKWQINQYWQDLDRKFKPVAIDKSKFEREIELGLWSYWLGHNLRVKDRWAIVKLIAGEYRRSISGPIAERLYQLGLVDSFEKAQLDSTSDEHPTHVFRRLEMWGAGWKPSITFGKV